MSNEKSKYTLIRIPPRQHDIFIVLDGCAGDEDCDGTRYWYNEGTCPTNVIRGVYEIIAEEYEGMAMCTDPHGILEYVDSVHASSVNISHEEPCEWLYVFPALMKGAKQLGWDIEDAQKVNPNFKYTEGSTIEQ